MQYYFTFNHQQKLPLCALHFISHILISTHYTYFCFYTYSYIVIAMLELSATGISFGINKVLSYLILCRLRQLLNSLDFIQVRLDAFCWDFVAHKHDIFSYKFTFLIQRETLLSYFPKHTVQSLIVHLSVPAIHKDVVCMTE